MVHQLASIQVHQLASIQVHQLASIQVHLLVVSRSITIYHLPHNSTKKCSLRQVLLAAIVKGMMDGDML